VARRPSGGVGGGGAARAGMTGSICRREGDGRGGSRTGASSGGRRRGLVTIRVTDRALGHPISIVCHSSSFVWCHIAPRLPPLPLGGGHNWASSRSSLACSSGTYESVKAREMTLIIVIVVRFRHQ
jgi:hypothetical protein